MTTPSDTASGLREELGRDTSHLGDTLKGRAKQEAATQKDAALGLARPASGAISAAANDLRDNPDAPEWMANGLQKVAQQIDRLSGELQGKSMDDLTREAERFGRDNPGTFLAIAAAAGFAAARVLRAGADHKRHGQDGASQGRSQAEPQAQGFAGDRQAWPADENIMPADTSTGTGTGYVPAYDAEGGTIR